MAGERDRFAWPPRARRLETLARDVRAHTHRLLPPCAARAQAHACVPQRPAAPKCELRPDVVGRKQWSRMHGRISSRESWSWTGALAQAAVKVRWARSNTR
eukprot:6689748-Prymnesium_polylepis.1